MTLPFINPDVIPVYQEYEQRNQREQTLISNSTPGDGTVSRDDLLLPIGLEAGRVLHAMILALKPSRILELGTSYGYSTLFLADAAAAVGGRVISVELADYKQAHARTMIERAGLESVVEFQLGDAPALIAADPGSFDFVLLDTWKEIYVDCFEAVYPKLTERGAIAADNMIYPENAREDVREYRDAVLNKSNMQTLLTPLGSGIELSIKWTPGNADL